MDTSTLGMVLLVYGAGIVGIAAVLYVVLTKAKDIAVLAKTLADVPCAGCFLLFLFAMCIAGGVMGWAPQEFLLWLLVWIVLYGTVCKAIIDE